MNGKPRSLGWLAALVLISLACSTSDLVALLVTPTPPPPPTEPPPTLTVILSPSSTPITHTPTFTLTPTLIGWDPTETPTTTGTLPATETLQATPTLDENIILLPEESGFVSVLLTQETIYFGRDCAFPEESEVRVKVKNPENVSIVSFFMRIRNKDTGNESGWDVGTSMASLGGGLYALTLNANDLHKNDRYSAYSNAWLEFQLVAFNSKVKEIGRTEKLLDRLSFAQCPQ